MESKSQRGTDEGKKSREVVEEEGVRVMTEREQGDERKKTQKEKREIRPSLVMNYKLLSHIVLCPSL